MQELVRLQIVRWVESIPSVADLNGQVNWDTLGCILTAHNLGEVWYMVHGACHMHGYIQFLLLYRHSLYTFLGSVCFLRGFQVRQDEEGFPG